MYPTPEYLRLIHEDRVRDARDARLARLAARIRACCNLTVADRFMRALRGTSPAG